MDLLLHLNAYHTLKGQSQNVETESVLTKRQLERTERRARNDHLELVKQKKGLQTYMEELQTKYRVLQEKITIQQREHIELKTTLEIKINNLIQESQSKEIQMNQNIQQKHLDIENLQRKIKLEEEEHTYNKQKLENEILKLENEISNMESTVERLNSNLSASQHSYEELKKHSESQIELLEQEKKRIIANVEELQTSFNNERQQLLGELSQAEVQLSQSQQEYLSLTEEYKQLFSSSQTVLYQLEESKSQNSKLNSDISNIRNEFEIVTQEKLDLLKKLADSERLQATLNSQIGDSKTQCTDLQKKIVSKETELLKAENVLSELRETLLRRESEIQKEENELRTKEKSLRDEITTMNEKINSLKNQLDQKETEKSSLKEKLESEISLIKSQLDEKEVSISKLETEKEQLSFQMKQTIDELNIKISDQESQLHHQNEEHEIMKDSFEHTITELKNTIFLREEDIRKSNDLNQLIVEQLQSSIQNLNQNISQRDIDISKQKIEHESKTGLLERELENVKLILSKKENEYIRKEEEKAEEIRELNKTLDHMRNILSKKEEGLHEKEEENSSYIQGLNKIIDDLRNNITNKDLELRRLGSDHLNEIDSLKKTISQMQNDMKTSKERDIEKEELINQLRGEISKLCSEKENSANKEELKSKKEESSLKEKLDEANRNVSRLQALFEKEREDKLKISNEKTKLENEAKKAISLLNSLNNNQNQTSLDLKIVQQISAHEKKLQQLSNTILNLQTTYKNNINKLKQEKIKLQSDLKKALSTPSQNTVIPTHDLPAVHIHNPIGTPISRNSIHEIPNTETPTNKQITTPITPQTTNNTGISTPRTPTTPPVALSPAIQFLLRMKQEGFKLEDQPYYVELMESMKGKSVMALFRRAQQAISGDLDSKQLYYFTEKAISKWISTICKEDYNPTLTFYDNLRDGILLCKIVNNTIFPEFYSGVGGSQVCNFKTPPINKTEESENVNQYLKFCGILNVKPLFTYDQLCKITTSTPEKQTILQNLCMLFELSMVCQQNKKRKFEFMEILKKNLSNNQQMVTNTANPSRISLGSATNNSSLTPNPLTPQIAEQDIIDDKRKARLSFNISPGLTGIKDGLKDAFFKGLNKNIVKGKDVKPLMEDDESNQKSASADDYFN